MNTLMPVEKPKKLEDRFQLVPKQLMGKFENLVLGWYENESDEQQAPPNVSYYNLMQDDEIHELIEECVRVNISQHDSDFPQNLKDWTEDDYDNLDDVICSGMNHHLSMIEADLIELLDFLNITYATDLYFYTTEQTLIKVHNPVVSEVW